MKTLKEKSPSLLGGADGREGELDDSNSINSLSQELKSEMMDLMAMMGIDWDDYEKRFESLNPAFSWPNDRAIYQMMQGFKSTWIGVTILIAGLDTQCPDPKLAQYLISIAYKAAKRITDEIEKRGWHVQ